MSKRKGQDPCDSVRSRSREQVHEQRRALLHELQTTAGNYAAPLMASFSMGGLRIDTAETAEFALPGLFAQNQSKLGSPKPEQGAGGIWSGEGLGKTSAGRHV